MRPFAQMIADRTRDPERCVREVIARLEKWKNMSGNKQVTLDEVAWFGAVMCIAGVKAQEDVQSGISHSMENGVHTVTADDSTRNIRDSAG